MFVEFMNAKAFFLSLSLSLSLPLSLYCLSHSFVCIIQLDYDNELVEMVGYQPGKVRFLCLVITLTYIMRVCRLQ